MEKEMVVEKLLHMNGGEDKYSYAQNSLFQKLIIGKAKHVVKESIKDLLCGFEKLPECINIADLGCSSGPNAFLAIEEIIKNIFKVTTLNTNLNYQTSIHVFFNDLVGNDFNSLFKLLPGFYERINGNRESSRSCFVSAMPGSFYGRLFPDKSIHFVHSSYSLMWLSQVPVGLASETGEPLNERNICWSRNTSPPSVHAAYSDQFNKDFKKFLQMRSQEMAVPGCLVFTIMSQNDEIDGCDASEFLGTAIAELVKQGLIEDTKLTTFNLPLYAPAEQEIRDAVDAEGSFQLNHLATFKELWDKGNLSRNGQTLKSRGEHVAILMRAVNEPLLSSHFGESIMDDLFSCHAKKVAEYFDMGKGFVSTTVISLSKN